MDPKDEAMADTRGSEAVSPNADDDLVAALKANDEQASDVPPDLADAALSALQIAVATRPAE